MNDRGVTVKLPDDVEGFVPVTQLGKEVNRPQDAFADGDLLPLKVLEFDKNERRIVLSVNAFFDTKEQSDLERYLGAHPTKTAAFGDALGEALNIENEPEAQDFGSAEEPVAFEEAPVEAPVEEPVEETLEETIEETVEEPVVLEEAPVEAPIEEPAEEPAVSEEAPIEEIAETTDETEKK